MHRNRLVIAALPALVLLAVASSASAAEPDPFDQSGVPLEKQPPTDAKVTKIVLVAGRPSHGPGEHEFFAGCAILMKLLQQTPGVFPVMAKDGWPKNPKTFTGAQAVVFFMDGGGGHPIIQKEHKDVVQKLMDKGVGFVNLHYAVEYPKNQSEHVLNWLGGYYETGYSTNPHWKADFKNLPEHPITRGVKPFGIGDEWYFNIRFAPESKKVVPILKATPPDQVRGTPDAKKHPGRSEILAWAFERNDSGRSFGFTGGHFHRNWGDANFRKVVLNALLWIARAEVPANGVESTVTEEDLKGNLDPKLQRR